MNIEITILSETPACECGNALTEGQTRCTKCLARDRWARKERARNRRNRRSETRRPPRGPRAAAAMGVSWT
ncbi:hypothetical protein HD597_008899 [Nonomuraea thailandensis]|uniref:Uncharacterized protein n=1 Tax=Nonomuraea thailandensis TaxID=1188745 RepID=A0A9X2GR35_9ACTN|nr:hypothetical protein [Nonomuraea thailandensis]MCP2361879.1 hypothetical protein [Nonomuraea thailandensis]